MNIILIISIAILSLLLGLLIGKKIVKDKVHEKNQEIEKEEQKLQLEIQSKKTELNILKTSFLLEEQQQKEKLRADLQKWEQEQSDKNLSFLKARTNLEKDISNLNGQIEEKKKSLNELDNQTKEAVKLIEEQVIDNMSKEIEWKGKSLTDQYEKLESDLLMKYIYLNDCKWDEYIERSQELDNRILEQENTLDDLQKKANAITESNKIAELEREKKNFYQLQLSDIDIEEIQKIRSIEPYLRKKEPLNKVIWKVYYEKPYNDLIGRVVGATTKSGIYKITHIDSGKCYIGQSNNIAERWRQHIKRGIGADPPTQSKLYPAMIELGVENFMFEILEECPASKLTEREKYYTEIYSAQSYGYVTRKG